MGLSSPGVNGHHPMRMKGEELMGFRQPMSTNRNDKDQGELRIWGERIGISSVSRDRSSYNVLHFIDFIKYSLFVM